MLTRCAFALLIKYCGEGLSLELALEEFDMDDPNPGDDEDEYERLKLVHPMDTFLLQWGKSSQMRKWLTEQKKDLGNMYGEGEQYA